MGIGGDLGPRSGLGLLGGLWGAGPGLCLVSTNEALLAAPGLGQRMRWAGSPQDPSEIWVPKVQAQKIHPMELVPALVFAPVGRKD